MTEEAHVSVEVVVEPAAAFDVFTRETNARWRKDRALLGRLGEFLDAINAGDAAFFERNLTDDAMLIYPGAGNTYTKARCVATMGDHPPYLKYDLADPRIVHIGESTAVLTHRATVMHTADEKPKSVVVATVLVQQGGTRRLALHQWTPADEE